MKTEKNKDRGIRLKRMTVSKIISIKTQNLEGSEERINVH